MIRDEVAIDEFVLEKEEQKITVNTRQGTITSGDAVYGNTKEGKESKYEFPFKVRTVNNTQMYHVLLSKLIEVKVNDRLVPKVDKQIKLYTPKDYKQLFVKKVIEANGIKRYLGNTAWLDSYIDISGNPGNIILFDPTLAFTFEGKQEEKAPEKISFTSKSQVNGANVEVLTEYCKQNYDYNLWQDESGVDKSGTFMKSLIIEQLGF